MSGENMLSGKLAEAIGDQVDVTRASDEKALDMVERCANAAEMGVRIALISSLDPLDAAGHVTGRKGAVLVEFKSPRGKVTSASVKFDGAGEVLFTHSRTRAKSFGASEIVTTKG